MATKISDILTRLQADSSGFKAEMERASGQLRSFGETSKAVGKDLMLLGGFATAPFALALREASNLEETVNKFDVVFGKDRTAVRAWADAYAEEVGRAREQIYAFSAEMQGFFNPMGFAADKTADLSKQITKLALDLASFNNVSDQEALLAIRSGLSGTGEALKKYGVLLNEVSIGQAAMQMGIDPAKMTEQEKVLARLNVIMRSTADAQDDATRSAGSFANQLKRNAGEIKNVAAELGNALIPAATEGLKALTSFLKPLGDFARDNPEVVRAVASLTIAVTALGGTLYVVGGIATKASAIAAAMPAVIAKITTAVEALSPALESLKSVGEMSALPGLMKVASASFAKLSSAATVAGKALLSVAKGAATVVSAPIATVLAAGAASAIALDYAVRETREALSGATKAAEGYTEIITKMNEESAELREADGRRIARLQELASAEKLTNREHVEAMEAIEELKKRYDNLGISLDSTTGKITIQKDVLRALREQMDNDELARLQQVQDALQQQIAAKQNEINYEAGSMNKLWWHQKSEEEIMAMVGDLSSLQDRSIDNTIAQSKILNAQRLGKTTIGDDSIDSRLIQSEEKRKSLLESELALKKKITESSKTEIGLIVEEHAARIKNLDLLRKDAEARRERADAAMKLAKATDNEEGWKAAQTEYRVAGLDYAEFTKNWLQAQGDRNAAMNKWYDGITKEYGDIGLTDYAKSVKAINDRYDEALKKLKEMRTEYEKLAKSGDNVNASNQLREIDAMEAKIKRTRTGELKDLEARTQADLRRPLEDLDRRREDSERSYQLSREDVRLSRLLQVNPSDAMKELTEMLAAAKKAMKEAEESYRRIYDSAIGDNDITMDEQQNIDTAKRQVDITTSAFDRIRQKLDAAGDALANRPASQVGSFYKSNFERLQNIQNSPEQTTAKNTSAIADGVRQVLSFLQSLPMLMSTPTFK